MRTEIEGGYWWARRADRLVIGRDHGQRQMPPTIATMTEAALIRECERLQSQVLWLARCLEDLNSEVHVDVGWRYRGQETVNVIESL